MKESKPREKKFSMYNPWGMHNETVKELFEKKESDFNLADEEAIRKQEIKERVLTIIEIFTRLRKEEYCHYNIFKHFIRTKLKCEFPEIVWNEKSFEYEFVFENKKYTFLMLSQIQNDVILKTNKRYNKCHEASICLGVLFPGASVLTGWINSLNGRYLHSVILLNNGKIIDYTKNIIMDMKEYVSLTNFTLENSLTNEELLEINTRLNKGIFDSKSLSVFGKEYLNEFANINSSFAEEDLDIKNIITGIRKKIENSNGER